MAALATRSCIIDEEAVAVGEIASFDRIRYQHYDETVFCTRSI